MTPTLPRPDGLIFDLDGTLVDTVSRRIAGWVEALAFAGIEAKTEQIAPMIGMDGRRLARLVAEARGRRLTDDAIEMIDKAAGAAFDRLNQSPRPLPGAAEVLAAADGAGLRWVIATSSRKEQVTVSVAALGLAAAPQIVDGSHVTHAKPAPDLLLLAAERLGVPPAACWAVGDSTWDMRAAVAAGMTAIGVTAGSAVGEEALLKAGAAIVVRALDELVGFVSVAGDTRAPRSAEMPTSVELLEAYDSQLRARIPDPLPARMTATHDGPVVRFEMPNGGMIGYRDLGGLDGAALDALIARQVRIFAERGTQFEWKSHGHDLPADLPERLLAAGFVPEELETVEIASVARVAGPPALPDGARLREVTDRVDLDRIAAFEASIWGDDHVGLTDMFESERAADPGSITILVVEAAGEQSIAEIVCAAWVRFEAGTDFATLWGGATLPAWRGRGVYRATVAYRANLAAERGFRFLEVDSSPDSRPILERLGFIPVTTTTPYVWSPSRTGSA